MKKLLFVLLFTLVNINLFADATVKPAVHAKSTVVKRTFVDIDVRPTSPGSTMYAGDSYGFYIDEVPNAVAYTWSLTGNSNATIYPSDFSERYIDVLFGNAGTTDVTCTVTLSDNSEVVYSFYAECLPQQ